MLKIFSCLAKNYFSFPVPSSWRVLSPSPAPMEQQHPDMFGCFVAAGLSAGAWRSRLIGWCLAGVANGGGGAYRGGE